MNDAGQPAFPPPGPPGPGTLPPSAAPRELLHRPRRLGTSLFTVLTSVLIVLGACVMGLLLVGANAPDAIAVGVVLAALPVGPVIACYLWLDRYEPEPVRVLVLAFLWGALAATGGALLLQSVDQAVFDTPGTWSAAIVAPITEEAAKGLFILLLLWLRRRVIDGVLDGIVYAGLIGVGFAFTENILYLGGAYMGSDAAPGGLASATGLFVVRGVFSPFAHPLFTSFTGLGVGFAVVARTHRWRVLAPLLGYVAAVIAHSMWNAAAFFGGGRQFVLTYAIVMVPAFLLLASFSVWARARERRMLTRSLSDAAQRGMLAGAEVPWLVRLSARRAARRNARAVAGPAGEKVMREYQQQAIELGFLHDRYLRGRAPDDVAERGNAMVARLQALRAYVVWPASPRSPVPQPGAQWGSLR